MSEQSSVQSVERAFRIIELLCEKGELGITELAALSGLNKATVYRFLSTLCGLGYVRKRAANEKYTLTLKFLRLSADTLSKIDIRRYARRYLEQILPCSNFRKSELTISTTCNTNDICAVRYRQQLNSCLRNWLFQSRIQHTSRD